MSISSLTLPITLIVGALVGIGIAFYQAYKRSTTFRNIVNQAFSGVANAFKAAKLKGHKVSLIYSKVIERRGYPREDISTRNCSRNTKCS